MIGSATPPIIGVAVSVGEHLVKTYFGLKFDLDTVWATGVAVIIILAMGFYLMKKATSGVPGRLQVVWEMIIEAVTTQVEGSIGEAGLKIIPLAVALFIFILVSNIFTVLGLGSKYEWLGAPTGDIALPLILALVVIPLVHIASIRSRGLKGYIGHYFLQPFPKALFLVNFFINFIEEFTKPITLTLRLFGNLLSGGLMLALIASLGTIKISIAPVGDVLVFVVDILWKVFDLAIGGVQAFIFALLTVLYFDMAMSTDHGDHKNEVLSLTGAVHNAVQETLAS